MMIYMRYTDAAGKVSIQGHNVWDRDRFVAARKAEHEKLGGTAEQISQHAYREHVWGPRESA